MAKKLNTQAAVAIIGCMVLLAIVFWVSWDLINRHQRRFDCGDGQRYTIDTREFATQYTEYSLQLEASLKDQGKISVKLDPVLQVKLSESMQSANEFRKFVVSGFNSCGVTRAQYAQFGARLEALDGLAREINELTVQHTRSTEDNIKLATLINEYANLSHRQGSD